MLYFPFGLLLSTPLLSSLIVWCSFAAMDENATIDPSGNIIDADQGSLIGMSAKPRSTGGWQESQTGFISASCASDSSQARR